MDGSTPFGIPSLIKKDSIHSEVYTDHEIFAEEMKVIFERTWVFVAHASEVPKRGDYLRRSMGVEPVIVVRGRDEIHVVANRCSHRGNLLCMPERGTKRSFACQYHGWVFGLNGDLLDIPFPEGCAGLDRSERGLKTARVETYRGFVFATFNRDAPPLEEHLGEARAALDRACNLSPTGEVEIGRTWVRHLFKANWKMLSENEADGYHVTFVHDSFAKAINREGKYENVLQGEEDGVQAVCRYLGNGHTELDYALTYRHPMEWLGVKEDRYPDYVQQMEDAYGSEDAEAIMRNGPPHTFIFPNLFLAETCLVMIQPVSVGETMNWHTPLYLKDAPDALNRRILRQGEVALGPSAFLTADDAVIAERQWRAVKGSPAWLDLTRGGDRETVRDGGILQSHYTDETSNRGFWQHYRSLFTE